MINMMWSTTHGLLMFMANPFDTQEAIAWTELHNFRGESIMFQVPLLTIPHAAKRVLIVGDYLSLMAQQVLQHQSVEQVVMVRSDRAIHADVLRWSKSLKLEDVLPTEQVAQDQRVQWIVMKSLDSRANQLDFLETVFDRMIVNEFQFDLIYFDESQDVLENFFKGLATQLLHPQGSLLFRWWMERYPIRHGIHFQLSNPPPSFTTNFTFHQVAVFEPLYGETSGISASFVYQKAFGRKGNIDLTVDNLAKQDVIDNLNHRIEERVGNMDHVDGLAIKRAVYLSV